MSINNQNKGFVQGRIKGSFIAIKGAYKFMTTEPSAMVQVFLIFLFIIAGFYYQISATEWMFQSIVFALVLSAEALNTAVEKLCDFVHIEQHKAIGFIKDTTAGAVFFTAIAAFVVQLIIFYPKIFL